MLFDFSSRPWRLLVTPPLAGAENMALDEALMERARRTGECVFRVYRWSRPTLSFGRHQTVRGRVDAARARAGGVDLVRRPTGGRALLHHREVTYSVTAPLARDESVRAWYEAVNAVLLSALRGLGVRAEPAVSVGRTPTPGSASCFQRPDAGEITVGGRKLVGSALVRERDALLQHGSILLEDDQPLLRDLLAAEDAVSEPAGTLKDALGRVPDVSEVGDALFISLRRAGARRASLMDDDAWVGLRVPALVQRYAGDAWTFRR